MLNMRMSQKVFKERKHTHLWMGESKLIRILGTDAMPYNPTLLEKFADKLAEKEQVTFNLKENRLSKADLTYYFRKEASKEGLYLTYSLMCHSENDSRDINEAAAEFERQMNVGEIDEQLNYRNSGESIAVIRNPYYHAEGEYAIVQGSRALGMHSLEEVKKVFASLEIL